MKGKVVVITGASSGIGAAIAEHLAAAGAKVVLGARTDGALQSLALRIQQAGGEAIALATDVTKREEVNELVRLATRTYGRLDVMINNAGVSQLEPMEALDVEGWEQMIDVNLKGTLYGIAAALAVFKTQNSGHIINIISTAGLRISPMMGVYAGTKNAIRTISEALRQESGGRWRVTGISPGMINTPFAGAIKNENLRQQIEQQAQKMGIPARAIAEAVGYAISQPDQVDVGDIVIRPTLQD